MSIFTIETIKSTPTYKLLELKKENAKCAFLEQPVSRKRITHAFTVHKNTGIIPNTLTHSEDLVVHDLIESHKQNLNL